ncbi:unnamed protein product [Effrenium voratum]|nr:unnamed protein product [Effrenium voratum]
MVKARAAAPRSTTRRRLAQLLLQRPAGASTKTLKANLATVKRYAGKACPHFGKRGVVEFFGPGGETAPRFNKYAGWVEWKNAVFLWVNAVGGSFENSFTDGGKQVSWYVGGVKPTASSPICQRLLDKASRPPLRQHWRGLQID